MIRPNKPDEAALVRRCQVGELAAFTELFHAYEAPLYRLAVTIVRHEADAQDALQETWLKVFRQIKDFRGEAALKTWLTSVLVNVCRDQLRRARVRQFLPLEWFSQRAHAAPPVPETVYATLRQRALLKCVDELEEAQRLPIILFYLEGLPAAEVGQILRQPVRVIYARLNAARHRLRALLQAEDTLEAREWEAKLC